MGGKLLIAGSIDQMTLVGIEDTTEVVQMQ